MNIRHFNALHSFPSFMCLRAVKKALKSTKYGSSYLCFVALFHYTPAII